MRRIGVILTKGGVGKTTTAINLAHGLIQSGKTVVVVDTDTQGQVSSSFDVTPEFGLSEVMTGEVHILDALFEARERLYILSGGRSLFNREVDMHQMGEGQDLLLRDSLAPLDDLAEIDYVLIDTGPSWSLLTANVLMYADELMLPIALENLAIDGLKKFVDRLGPVHAAREERFGEGIELSYVVPTLHDKRLKQSEEFLEQLQEFCGDVLTPSISRNVRVSECSNHGQTIFEYAPRSRGAKDYQSLTNLVLDDE